MIAFFVTASRLTKVGAARKRELEDGHTEGGNRNWVQVAANGALGTLLAAAYHASTRARGAAPEQPLDAAALPLEPALQAGVPLPLRGVQRGGRVGVRASASSSASENAS